MHRQLLQQLVDKLPLLMIPSIAALKAVPSHDQRIDPCGNVATGHMQSGLCQFLHVPIDSRQAEALAPCQTQAAAKE